MIELAALVFLVITAPFWLPIALAIIAVVGPIVLIILLIGFVFA